MGENARRDFAEVSVSFERGKTIEISQVKEKLTKIRRMIQEEPAAMISQGLGFSSTQSVPTQSLLEALESINDKLKHVT